MIQKKRSLFLAGLLLCAGIAQAQNVAINTDGSKANPNAILDIKSADKGLLIPRLTSEARLKIAPTQGLLVYDVNTNSFWYNTGRSWVSIPSAASADAVSVTDAWLLGGNAGTVDGTHFLGTTDGVPLNFRVNNMRAGRITQALGNTYLGVLSGPASNNGNDNVGIGISSLSSNTGTNNTAVGSMSMPNNTTGFANTGIGRSALFTNTIGVNNTVVGAFAMYSNKVGSSNNAIGVNAMYSNDNGNNNTAIGIEAMYNSTSGFECTAIGNYALHRNTSSPRNTVVGFRAGQGIAGSDNTAVGAYTLNNTNNIAVHSRNVAIGSFALERNEFGDNNVAVGMNCMGTNTTGDDNIAIGQAAMFSNTSGNGNIAVGRLALNAGNGNDNVAIGTRAMVSTTIGHTNVAVGANSMLFNTTGEGNVAVGYLSLRNNTSGVQNVAVGNGALFSNTDGYTSVAVGINALVNSTRGVSNVGLGAASLFNDITGFGNTGVGTRANVSSGNLTNATAIGFEAIVNASNKVRIGNASVTVIEGQVPFTTPSDGRYKFGVQEDVKGLDFIMQLRPVTYQFDVKKYDANLGISENTMGSGYDEALKIRRSGFIAQEVEQAALKTGYNFSGIIKPKNPKEHYSLSYDAFVVPLVKAMQEQQQIIDELQKKNASLEERLNKLEKLLETKN